MVKEYVTKEEFNNLQERFNDLCFRLEELDLKKKADFSDLIQESEEDYEELDEETINPL